MSAVLVLFGGSLTGMLTWISGTYVLKMRALPGALAPYMGDTNMQIPKAPSRVHMRVNPTQLEYW